MLSLARAGVFDLDCVDRDQPKIAAELHAMIKLRDQVEPKNTTVATELVCEILVTYAVHFRPRF